MPTWLRTMTARVWSLWRADAMDREFDDELRTHLTLAEADKVRRGMSPADARREARVELGGLQQLREAGRAARGLPWLGTLWLDVKLGARLLRKSWGLTLVGGLAMTVVIAIAAGAFSVVQVELGSTLPLEDGDQVVALTVQDLATSERRNPSRRDLERWRTVLTSVEDVGTFRTVERNLVIGGGVVGDPVSIAEMTASGFRVARVPPMLGRALVEADERVGAVPVVVVGYDVWRSRFLSDPAAVGRRVSLDGADHTVVGIMPEGFAFPVHHGLWTPLAAMSPAEARDDRPAGFTFARLAPGATERKAEAELTAVGLLPLETTTPAATARRPRVVPYTLALTVSNEAEEYAARLALILVGLLLLPPCANIAILVYARTVTRQAEFAARYALGAGRGRLVSQLFVEVLVLAGGAAAAAIVLLTLFYRLDPFTGPNEPFWREYGVSATTVFFAAGLAVFAALVAGLVPALQATGRLALSGFSALSGRTSLRLGTTWTALVVSQIALSVAVLPSAVEYGWGLLRPGLLGPGFAAEEYLTARLTMDGETEPAGLSRRPGAARIATQHAELVRRLSADSDVTAITVSAALPGREPWAVVEVDVEADPLDGPSPTGAVSAERLSRLQVVFNRVDEQFFSAFDVPLLSGRRFGPSDFEAGRNAIIVNRTMAQDLAGAGNPLGRVIRYQARGPRPAAESRLRYEIVGVVDDLPANSDRRRIYHPLTPGETPQVTLALRIRPTAEATAEGLRETAFALDPALRVNEIVSLDEVYRRIQLSNSFITVLLGAVVVSVLLLSAAGLYALMSFTVNQRTREIGIRSALGAQPRRLLAGIFRRALGQVGAGAAVGILLAVPLNNFLSTAIEEMRHASIPGVVPMTAVFMIVVGLLAAAGPARRGLRVDPTEALRDG